MLSVGLIVSVLQKLLSKVEASKVNHPTKARNVVSTNEDLLRADMASSTKITHGWLWPTVGKFLRAKDVVVSETGQWFRDSIDIRHGQFRYPRQQISSGRHRHFASSVGEVRSLLRLAEGCSIGYSVGAVLGAAFAARELSDGHERRVMLFVGDGSLQLTAQVISTFWAC
jgi:pyruvate decarboxylase